MFRLPILLVLLSSLCARPSAANAETYCGDFHTWDKYPPSTPGPASPSARLVIDDWNPSVPPGKGSFKVTLWAWEALETPDDKWSYMRTRASESVQSSPGPTNAPPESRAVLGSNDSRFQMMFASRYTVRILDSDTHDPHPYAGYEHKGDVIYEACDSYNCTKWIPVGNMVSKTRNSGLACPRTIVVKPVPVIYPKQRPPTPVHPAPPDVCAQHPDAEGCPKAQTSIPPRITTEVPGGATCYDFTLKKYGTCPPEPKTK